MSDMAMVPFDDRGLAYGDGLFETVLLREGAPVLWEYHRARLLRGCRVLQIPPPADQALKACWQDTRCKAAQGGLEVLKIMLTRGSGGRGYAIPAEPEPRLLSRRVPFSPTPERWAQGVVVRLCHWRLGHQPGLAGIKHLNRLDNVMARQEWQEAEVAEGLLADQQGHLVEATSMNLFWQQDGQLWTPDLGQCGVAGTLRAALIEMNRVGVGQLPVSGLADVEHLWLANSVQGVWPVVGVTTPEGASLGRWSIRVPDPLQVAAHRLMGYPFA